MSNLLKPSAYKTHPAGLFQAKLNKVSKIYQKVGTYDGVAKERIVVDF